MATSEGAPPAEPSRGEAEPHSVHMMYRGCPVNFPLSPYRSQNLLMSKIIGCLENKTHALLESPTGTGKSLALLCSTLAWQRHEAERTKPLWEEYYKKLNEARTKLDGNSGLQVSPTKPPATPLGTPGAYSVPPIRMTSTTQASEMGVSTGTQLPVEHQKMVSFQNDLVYLHDDMEDFRPPKRSKSVAPAGEPGLVQSPQKTEPPATDVVLDSVLEELAAPPCVPTIYFGTRTHRQIEGLVKELRRTTYRNAQMTILSSREWTCINDSEFRSNKWRTRTEMCKSLMDTTSEEGLGGGCRFLQEPNCSTTHMDLQATGLRTPWDIEDLVKMGRRQRSCPYFVARSLVRTADIVFCPYNYLLDPRITSSLQIDLAGNIIVLDEAHNIEDICRESASFTLCSRILAETLKECRKLEMLWRFPQEHRAVGDFLENLSNWVDKQKAIMVNKPPVNGSIVVVSLEQDKITKESLAKFRVNFNKIVEPPPPQNKNFKVPMVSSTGRVLLEGILVVLDFIFKDNCKNKQHYYVAMEEVWEMCAPLASSSGDEPFPWQRPSSLTRTPVVKVHFECMYPAVVFEDIAAVAHSVVLTSGTLAPLMSFSSELGVKFGNTFEGLHVIDRPQLYARSLNVGPTGENLTVVHTTIDKLNLQDEVGRVVLNVCRMVPYGVLLFFTSYNNMDKFIRRWQSTGIWDQLSACKSILIEPRLNGELEPIINQYYNYIAEAENANITRDYVGNTGALLLAVMRGKVSEGSDFTDNRARAVISVGIPFANMQCTKVKTKRHYNNCRKDLMTDTQWYNAQTFRAYNQAIGRCIRHRNDKGAVILLDSRFETRPDYKNLLPKWFREFLQPSYSWEEFMMGLREFSDQLF